MNNNNGVKAMFQDDSVCITEVNPLSFVRRGEVDGDAVQMILPTYANRCSVSDWVAKNKGRCTVADRFMVRVDYKDSAGGLHEAASKTDFNLLAVTSDNRFFSVNVENLDKHFVQV